MPPIYAMREEGHVMTQYLITFAGLLVVGLVISSLATRTRAHAEAAQIVRGLNNIVAEMNK